MSEQESQLPTRVALFLDRYAIPAWVAELLDCFTQDDGVEIAGVMIAHDRRRGGRTPGSKPRWQDGRLRRGMRRRLMTSYRKLVDRNLVFADAWRHGDADLDSQVLFDLPGTFTESDRKHLVDLNVDVVVHCGLRAVPSEVITGARFGVWSLLGSPAGIAQAYPAGFWPVLKGAPLTRSTLAVTFADRAPIVLAESWMATSRHSTRDNISRHYWKMLFGIPRAVQRMRQLGANAFFADCRTRVDQSFERNFSAPHPGALAYSLYVVRAVFRKAIALVDNNLFEQRWRLRRATPFALTGETRLAEVQHNPDRIYRADPFIHVSGESRFLFFEEYCDRRKLGHLSRVSLDANGRPDGGTRMILQRPYHLSYPQILDVSGEYYMLPETSANQTIELYKATAFPDEWTLHSVLMQDIDASDATLLRRDGLWWMFANVKSHPAVSSQDECFLYFAEDLVGPWQAHPLNPVVSDCRTSRPGGAMIEKNGRLIRPTQDCTYRYGYGLNFMEVTALSTTDYREVLLEHIPPRTRSGAIGIHTYAESGNIAFVDELYRSPRWKNRVRD
ncbi:MAG: hypothetical protein AAFQ16_10060 [Pseudomonadota bacterium]